VRQPVCGGCGGGGDSSGGGGGGGGAPPKTIRMVAPRYAESGGDV
jgi:hypothetical protein